MRYLTIQEVLVLNAKMIEATGGSKGVRDIHLLLSLIERPKSSFGGKEMFLTVHEKAAVYLESIAKYHVFLDGNKRTAIVTAARFLFLNGYKLTASNKEVEVFVLRVATEKLPIEDIAEWFKCHAEKA